MSDDIVGHIVEPRRSSRPCLTTDDRGADGRSGDAATLSVAADESAGGCTRDDVKAALQTIGEDLLEAVRTVRPALRGIEVIAPRRQERQVATETAGHLHEVLRLRAVVNAVVGEHANTDVRGRADAPRNAGEETAIRSQEQRAVDRIVQRELTLAVLLRLTTGGEQLEVELAVTEEIGVVRAGQVTGVVPGRRNDVLLEHRRSEGVANVQVRTEAGSGRVVVQQTANALETRKGRSDLGRIRTPTVTVEIITRRCRLEARSEIGRIVREVEAGADRVDRHTALFQRPAFVRSR